MQEKKRFKIIFKDNIRHWIHANYNTQISLSYWVILTLKNIVILALRHVLQKKKTNQNK